MAAPTLVGNGQARGANNKTGTATSLSPTINSIGACSSTTNTLIAICASTKSSSGTLTSITAPAGNWVAATSLFVSTTNVGLGFQIFIKPVEAADIAATASYAFTVAWSSSSARNTLIVIEEWSGSVVFGNSGTAVDQPTTSQTPFIPGVTPNEATNDSQYTVTLGCTNTASSVTYTSSNFTDGNHVTQSGTSATVYSPLTGCSLFTTYYSGLPAGATGSLTLNLSASVQPIAQNFILRPGSVSGAVALSATGAMTVGSLVSTTGAVSMNATTTETVVPLVTDVGTVSMAATASETVAGQHTSIGAVSMNAATGLTETVFVGPIGTFTAAAATSLAVSATNTVKAVVSFAPTASLTAVGKDTALAAVLLHGTAGMTTAAKVTEVGLVAMIDTTTLTLSGVVTKTGLVNEGAFANLVVGAFIIVPGSGLFKVWDGTQWNHHPAAGFMPRWWGAVVRVWNGTRWAQIK